MKITRLLLLLVLLLVPLAGLAEIAPTATYFDKDGNEVTEWKDIPDADAPLHVRFQANATNLEDGATLEWHFSHQGKDGVTQLTRYEEDTEFDFVESGVTLVSLLVMYEGEELERKEMSITIAESHLEMPNAFSPNDDTVNDIYGAKGMANPSADGAYKSIVEFHAYIFNRWGQKLYEWTDITKGWDGKYKGRPVKDGVYFVLVKARGADGIEYNIRRDVNLIRGHNTAESTTEGEQ
jgi:gliding motility-associated-like protein